MSKIFDKLKNADSPSGESRNTSEGKNMEINDMKEQILAKLRAKREAAAPVPQDPVQTVKTEEMIKVLNKPVEPVRVEERVVVKPDEELVRRYEALKKELEAKRAEAEEKSGQVGDLRKKLDEANNAIGTNQEALKVKDAKTSEMVRLMRELDAVRKAAAEHQAKAASLADENRKAAASRDEALKQHEKIKKESELRERAAQDLERRLKEERSRAEASAELLKARDKKVADADRLIRDLDGAKKMTEEARARFEALHVEHKKVAADRDEAAKLLKKLRGDAEARERTVQDLQKRLSRMAEIEETLRTRDKRLADADRLAKELDVAKRSTEEYRVKWEAAQSEIRKITALHEEVAGDHGKLKEEIGARDAATENAKKTLAAELTEMTKERDRIAANVESLRSKLYVAMKETKEQLTKIAQLEEASRLKDKRSAEFDKTTSELVEAKNLLETKLRSLEIEHKSREDKMAGFNDELTSREGKILQVDKLYKDLQSLNHETNLQLQARERDKKDLETKVGQMHLELEAKTKRLGEIDNLYKELQSVVDDLTSRLQTSQREKKEFEAVNGDIGLKLENAERARKDLDARMLQLGIEIEAKTRRLEEADKFHTEMEALVKDATMGSQVSQRKVEDLNKEIAALSESLKGALNKIKEVEDGAHAEIKRITAEITALKNIVREKEKKELEYRSSIEHLENEMQARDSKIEGDLKYTDKIVKEVTELRKKLAMLERQTKG